MYGNIKRIYIVSLELRAAGQTRWNSLQNKPKILSLASLFAPRYGYLKLYLGTIFYKVDFEENAFKLKNTRILSGIYHYKFLAGIG